MTAASFAGALAAVGLALALSSLDRAGRHSTIVLAGIAVHSLAQTALMCLKLTADPERELASIEYWIMGSLNGVSGYAIGGNLALCTVCVGTLFLLHRQIILLSAEEGEARMLGVAVGRLRVAVLLTATLAVSCVVSLSGLISFVGLLAPHGPGCSPGAAAPAPCCWRAAGGHPADRRGHPGPQRGRRRAAGEHLH